MRLAALLIAAALASPGATTCRARVLPGLGREHGTLEAVAFASPNEGWAVGEHAGGTFVERWDGHRWAISPTPQLGSATLPGVAAAPNDAWAVGTATGHTLILHWTGSDWRIVPSPNPFPGAEDYLVTVARLSVTDAWAVGTADRMSQSRVRIVEHWNGREWTAVTDGSDENGNSGLNGVAAIAPNDVWAVGYDGERTFTEHWDGSSWRQVASPNGRGSYSALLGLSAVSPNDVWAVGDHGSKPLVEHWDGQTWRIVPSAPLDGYGVFWRVAASKTSAWAVGERDVSARDHRALVERWDGRRWRVVKVAKTGPNTILFGAALRTSTELVAVGFRGAKTLGERCACRR
jgi:hypothetical protein